MAAPTILTAFGDTKSINQWSRDPRCAVTYNTLTARVRKGWDHTKAITTPPPAKTNGGAGSPSHPNYKLYKLWSQLIIRTTKPDATNYIITINLQPRIEPSWTKYPQFEAWALTNGYRKGLYLHRRNQQAGFTTDNCYWAAGADSPFARPRECFGEFKTLKQWLQDPRCVAVPHTIKYRLLAGWDFERAISTPASVTKESSPTYQRLIQRKLRPNRRTFYHKLDKQKRLELEAGIITGLSAKHLAKHFGVSASYVVYVTSQLRVLLGLPGGRRDNDAWLASLHQWKALRGITE